jgi:hypothetical protein
MAKRNSTTPGIRRIRLESGEVRYRVQIQIHGTRRSHLCKTNEQALALRREWIERGLPPKNAPGLPDEISATVATVDDGLRHRVLNLEQRGKSGAVAERIRVFLKKTWPAGAAMPLNGLTVSTSKSTGTVASKRGVNRIRLCESFESGGPC